MDMIERVARAIYEARDINPLRFGNGEPWDTTLEWYRLVAMAQARAVLEAMREPTGAMVDAGHVVIHEQGPPWLCEADRTKPYHVISMPEDVAQRWRQMIGAALQDKSP